LSRSQKDSNLCLKCARIRLVAGLYPDPLGNLSYPDPLATMKGILLRDEEREGKEGQKGREGSEGREGRGVFTSPEQGHHLSKAGTGNNCTSLVCKRLFQGHINFSIISRVTVDQRYSMPDLNRNKSVKLFIRKHCRNVPPFS